MAYENTIDEFINSTTTCAIILFAHSVCLQNFRIEETYMLHGNMILMIFQIQQGIDERYRRK